MAPQKPGQTEKFEEFVEAVFNPLTRDSAPEPEEEEEYRVEAVVKKRNKGKELEYCVKYEGYSGR